MQDVVLSIRSGLVSPDWDWDWDCGSSIEVITPGKLYRKDGDVYITYEESGLTGMRGTETTLKVGPKRVTLTRTGEITSEMVFEQGFKHLSYYDTGTVGGMSIGVNARKVNTVFDETGGLINVEYAVEVENELRGHNNIKIEVKNVH